MILVDTLYIVLKLTLYDLKVKAFDTPYSVQKLTLYALNGNAVDTLSLTLSANGDTLFECLS